MGLRVLLPYLTAYRLQLRGKFRNHCQIWAVGNSVQAGGGATCQLMYAFPTEPGPRPFCSCPSLLLGTGPARKPRGTNIAGATGPAPVSDLWPRRCFIPSSVALQSICECFTGAAARGRLFAGEAPLGSWKGSSIGDGWAGFALRLRRGSGGMKQKEP